jgi:putative redox protein
VIYATSDSVRYRTRFSDGVHEAVADTTVDKGGQHQGFRPHDLLEAALACCVNMSVRIYADNHGIPLRAVTTKTDLDRSRPSEVTFCYKLVLDGELTLQQKERLLEAAKACPIRQTLSKAIRFECDVEVPSD